MLDGEQGPVRDVVALNAAAALVVADAVADLAAGVERHPRRSRRAAPLETLERFIAVSQAAPRRKPVRHGQARLQCPACGRKHRLSELTGEPIFSCEECGRLLKTPVEYRRADPASPLEPPRVNGTSQVQRGGSAARDQTAVIRTPTAAAASGSAPAPPRAAARTPSRPSATLSLPLMVLGWVAALVIGGVIVRYLAKFTGLLTGDSVIDLITGSGYGRYLRLFAVIPFWALATAGLMTLFVEGGRRWQANRATPGSPRAAAGTPAPTKVKQPRVPKASPNPRQPAPSPPPAETSAPSGAAAAAPKARRIPKREHLFLTRH